MFACNAVAVARTRQRNLRQERSEETRGLLLDATIEALVEVGYARASTTEIADRAGVSRGAQLHHYPTKVQLVTAAVEHVFELRVGELEALETESADEWIDHVWRTYDGPAFAAWLELQVAARTDPELRESLRSVNGRLAERVAAAAPVTDTGFLFAVLDGLALHRITHPGGGLTEPVLAELKRVARGEHPSRSGGKRSSR
jgi:AcrR family transcriptional regulator